jgi:superfamily II DNA or RNA helicase
VKIEVNNVRSRIIEFPPEPWDRNLRKAFTKKSKDSYWQQKHGGIRGWDGSTCFISKKRGEFPTGILPLILEWCKKEDIEPVIVDKRKKPKPLTTDIPEKVVSRQGDEYVLRYYQTEAIEKCLEHGRGLIKTATGGGKTLTASVLIECLDKKTLYVVERINLATQTKKKFTQEYGIASSRVGIVGGKHNQQDKQIVITTVQSSHKLENLDEFEVVIVDESHHSKAKTYIALLKQLKNAYYRFGFSGTVFGEDPLEDMYRVSQFGNVLYEVNTQTLIDEGVLAKPTIRFIEINTPNVEGIYPYIEMYKEGIVRNYERNRIICKFANEWDGKILILFKFIEHGQILKKYIPKALYADGDTPSDEREKMFTAFNRMSEGVMIASTILDEGIDFEHIHHLIIAGGEKSVIKQIQRLGRGLRKNDTMSVNVIDFMDSTSATLKKHSKLRVKVYENEGHDIVIYERS